MLREREFHYKQEERDETVSIRIVYCNEIDSVLDLLKADYKENLGRHRDLKVFRGINDSNYTTYTSLQRNCGDTDPENRREVERQLLNNFAKYAERDEPNLNRSEWHKMIIGQHHGLPTRLLDWSRSPAVALHFAMTESNWDMLDQRDCAVWCLDVEKLNEKLPGLFKSSVGQGFFTIESLIDVYRNDGKDEDMSVDAYDREITADGNTAMIMLEPPSIDVRIANQYSLFSVIPSCVSSVDEILDKLDGCVTKYVISRNLRWEIRDILDRMNVSERLIYPGLDGIAQWLGRYYYPRKLQRFQIIRQNIADAFADVIAVPCDAYYNKGAAADAVVRAAGKEVSDQRKVLWEGRLAETPSGELTDRVRKIYYVVGQHKREDDADNKKLVSSYLLAMETALKQGYRSIAFPLLGSGHYGYDEVSAWRAAIRAKDLFFADHQGSPFTVTVCVTGEEKYVVGNAVKEGRSEDEIREARLKLGRYRGERQSGNTP